ncbi:hypothetical protein KA531_03165 [Candidatus Saccharibacteria bacterium]|nr:hypothetical protein [Candidatus Saccharibacteria bacterium]
MGRITNYLFRPINRYMVRMVAGVLAVALLLWGSFVWGENQRRKQEEERVAITGEVSPDGTDQAVISDPTDSVLDQDNPIDDSQDNQSSDSSDDASQDQQDQDDQSDDQIASTSQEEDNSSDSSGQVAGEQDSSTNGEQGDLNGDGAYTDNSKDVQPGERNALPSTGLAEFVSVVLPAIILSVLLYKNKEQADRLLSLKK